MPTALELFESHHRAVFRFLKRMGAEPADAEDMTQQVFLRVLTALPAYEERQLEKAWVFRIARNVRLDHLRSETRSPLGKPLDDHLGAAVRVGHEQRLDIDAALARLGEAEREAFLLREVGGFGYVEISGVTGSSPDAVRSRIHRARLALRQALSRSGDVPAGSVRGTGTLRGR